MTPAGLGRAAFAALTADLPPVVRVPRRWPGETVVILGGGPSLTPADVAYCRGKARVIAVKEAFMLAPWADVLYAADSSWWDHYMGVPAFAGLKFGIQGQRIAPHDHKMACLYPDVQILQETGAEGLELDPGGLRTGYNSGYQAIGLAKHLGAARVLLLGFDLWAGPDGPNWHHADRPHRDSNYGLFLQAFATLVAPIQLAGVTVINCSRRTVLTGFQCLPLEEALP